MSSTCVLHSVVSAVLQIFSVLHPEISKHFTNPSDWGLSIWWIGNVSTMLSKRELVFRELTRISQAVLRLKSRIVACQSCPLPSDPHQGASWEKGCAPAPVGGLGRSYKGAGLAPTTLCTKWCFPFRMRHQRSIEVKSNLCQAALTM